MSVRTLQLVITVGDYFGQGDLTLTADPTTLARTFRSRAYHKTSDLRNLQSIRKVFL